MGRPRQYGSAAERQQAFRRRQEAETARVDRAGLARLHERLVRLQLAVCAAAKRGDESARACQASSVETVLDQLIQHFEGRS